MTRYILKYSKQAKNDLKLAYRQGLDIEPLEKVLDILANGKILPEKYRDHKLSGKYKNFRECHITPDLLLVYHKNKSELILTAVRIGSHSHLKLG